MAITVKTPGVYIEEISVFPPSVAPVATAIPAFIGYTATVPSPNVPIRITSLLEFVQFFGGPFPQNFDVVVTDTPVVNPTSRTITVNLSSSYPKKFYLYQALQMYFDNGGGPCYVRSAGDYDTATPSLADYEAALDSFLKEDEPTLLVFPDAATLLSSFDDYGSLVARALRQCNTLQDRFVISDVPNDTVAGVDADYRGKIGTNYLKYGAAYMPFVKSLFTYGINQTTKLIDSNNPSLDNLPLNDGTANSIAQVDPQLYQQILAEINKLKVTLPPSGAVAGIYASVDRDRGVWKAPANVSVASISGPTIAITNAQQDNLNVDATSGKSINVLRAFTGKGTLVWGARTLAGNDNEWRYVNVRRLFIFAEESIKKATEFVVFEPNDANTWLRVKGLITSFLTNLWRDGALVGATTDQAFFVQVGLNETMSAQDILEGKMIVRVGLAASRPAEFIILQFMHKLQES